MTQATLTQTQAAPKSGENTGLWLLKLLTGPFIFILIGIHFTVNHLLGESAGLLSFNQVINYYKVWIVPVMEGCFLALVIVHSLLGLRSIVLDLHPSKGAIKLVNWVFLIGGLAAFVYGIWLIRAITLSGIGS